MSEGGDTRRRKHVKKPQQETFRYLLKQVGSGFDMVSDHINMRNCIQATRTTHRKAKKVAQPEEFKEPDHVRPSTQREQKPVVPFDYSRYNPTELKEVNKLRIETRIR